MWRISDDHWDLWDSQGKHFPQGTKDQFARLAAWNPYAKPGNWPDADMLPIGELRPTPGWGEPRTSRLTADEVKTELTLWAMARSPMILGANLTLLDDATVAMLTNPFLLAVSQTATASAQVLHEGDLIAWKAVLPGGRVALAVFNTGDAPMQVEKPLAEYDSSFGAEKWLVHDVWRGTELGKQNRMMATLPGHGCVLLMLHRAS